MKKSNISNNDAKYFFMFLTSMIMYGTIGIFRRFIPVESATLAMLRGIIGVSVLIFVKLILRQKPDFSAIKKNVIPLVISGFFIGINWLTLFEAYNYTSVAIATLCYYMAPVFTIIVSPFLLKEKLNLHKIICILIALVGMILISGVFKGEKQPSSFIGIALALVSAILYSCVILTNKKITGINPYDKTIIQLAASAVILLPYVLLKEKPVFSTLQVSPIIMILIVGIIHTGLAYAFYFGSLEHLAAQKVAIFSYIDPIVAVLLSTLLLGESMGALEIAGTICVLCAAIGSEIKF